MNDETVLVRALRGWRFTVCAIALCALSVTVGKPAMQASASVPTALELADHAISNSSLLADESPYELIDPVGPGGATEDQAKGEVLSSTMVGGIYNNNTHYGGGGYFDSLYNQSMRESDPPHGYHGSYRSGPQQWGGGYPR